MDWLRKPSVQLGFIWFNVFMIVLYALSGSIPYILLHMVLACVHVVCYHIAKQNEDQTL